MCVLAVVRSIRDLQVMLTYACVDACVAGRQAYQLNGVVIYPPPSLRAVDFLVHTGGWEELVEVRSVSCPFSRLSGCHHDK